MVILLADDQPKVRFALRTLLRRQPGLKVIGEALDAGELLAQAEAACPDLVLLDWELPGLDAAILRVLQKRRPGIKIIALSGRTEMRDVALAAGADSFVSKGDPPERLLAAVAECQVSATARP